jgi:hypothetical protein
MTRVAQIPFPLESRLQALLAGAYYVDAFAAPLADPGLTPLEIMARTGQAFPAWGEVLMSVRNGVVRWFGIRDVGAFRKVREKPLDRIGVGDRFGIFRVLALDPDELVLGIDDTHLDVRVSVLKRGDARGAGYVLGSVVTTHNWLGRLYMIPVAPFHRLIVASMMRRADL